MSTSRNGMHHWIETQGYMTPWTSSVEEVNVDEVANDEHNPIRVVSQGSLTGSP